MPNRILLIGGVDHNLRIPFLLALRDRGFEPIAASSGDPKPFELAGLEHHCFSFNRFVSPFADWQAIQSLRRLFRTVRPDVMQSFDNKLNLLVAMANMRGPHCRLIRTINGLGWLYASRSAAAHMLRPVYRGLHRLASLTVSRTLFQNREDMAYFEKSGLVKPGTARLVPGSGVDVDGFEASAASGPSREEIRKSLGLEGRDVVITVSRLTRQKGILTLLKAAEIVHAARPNVCFLLVGPRESEGPLAIAQHVIDQHTPYVIATGWRKDVASLLKAADVCAFPTEYREGVPRAVMEAAIANLPIVTTDVPGCHDLVRDGWSGYLFPPRNHRALADKILRALTDRETALTMAGRASELVRNQYALGVALDRYVAVYQEVLEANPAP